MKSAVLVSVLALTAFAVWEESALARNYLNCLSKKIVIVDAPKGTTSSSTEENFGFWVDEATKIVTLADGKKLNVRRFDDGWISAVSGDVSYELDRQNGNLTYAGSTMKDGIATTIIGSGRCKLAAGPASPGGRWQGPGYSTANWARTPSASMRSFASRLRIVSSAS